VFTLPQGAYRFRSDKNGTQFWSGAMNHCAVPGCAGAAVTVTVPLTVTVFDTSGLPQAGLPVCAFSGTTYSNYNQTTNASGQAVFTLPQGNYHFRSDKNGTQFWSGAQNGCQVPGCKGLDDSHRAGAIDRDRARHQRRRPGCHSTLPSVSVPGRAGVHHSDREFDHKEKRGRPMALPKALQSEYT
jgi:hypothetical protein